MRGIRYGEVEGRHPDLRRCVFLQPLRPQTDEERGRRVSPAPASVWQRVYRARDRGTAERDTLRLASPEPLSETVAAVASV